MNSGVRFCPACGERYFGNEKICPADGCKLITAPVSEDLNGITLNGKYRISKKLGEGGFGTVYEGYHLGLNKVVAIKVLNPELRNNELVVKRFLNEVQAITRLSHPHTVTTHDLDQTEDGLLFLVMEKVEGGTLAKLLEIENGKLHWKRVVGIVTQICESLEEAHEKGVIHRDLKPENIIVADRFGVKDYVKVLDFGIAKIVSDKPFSTLTEKGKLVGSPPYMSPEHCKGEELDGRSDLYSLGVMIYQMLTGRLPFRAKTPEHMLISHTIEEPIPIPEIAPDLKIPVELEKIVMRLLKKNREERYSSAAALKSALLFTLETPEQGSFHDDKTRRDIEFTVEMDAKKTLKDFPAKKSRKFQLIVVLAIAAIFSASAALYFLFTRDQGGGEVLVETKYISAKPEERDISTEAISVKDAAEKADIAAPEEIGHAETRAPLKKPASHKRKKQDVAEAEKTDTHKTPEQPSTGKAIEQEKTVEKPQPDKKQKEQEPYKEKSIEKKQKKPKKEGIRGRADEMFNELDEL